VSSSQKPRLQSIKFSVGKYGSIYVDCSPYFQRPFTNKSTHMALGNTSGPSSSTTHPAYRPHQKLTLSSQTLASPLRRHLASQPAAQHQVLHKVLTPTANQISISSSKLAQTVIIYLGIYIPTCLTAREVVVSLSHLESNRTRFRPWAQSTRLQLSELEAGLSFANFFYMYVFVLFLRVLVTPRLV